MVILLAIFMFAASAGVRWWMKKTYARWRQVPNTVGATGWQVARHILDANGLQQVQLEVASGELTDHYIPSQKLIRLSESINFDESVASIAVAAHEVGHALQDQQGYAPLKLKAILMPAAVGGNNLGMMLALGGGMFGSQSLVTAGLLLFAISALMPLLTLPIEFDASHRALAQLQTLNMVDQKDYTGAKAMLRAAAMTYVAGAASSMAVVAFVLLRVVRR